MKNLYYIFLLPLLMLVMGGLTTACEDNENYSSLHVLTDDELAELARQQRVRDSLAQVINADTVIDIELTDYPITNWSGGQNVYLDIDAVAELFGLTPEEVYSGIIGAEDAPKIQGFAIQGPTHADLLQASTTNGPWGHWWTVNGEAGKAYDDAESFFYCEWQLDDEEDYTTGHFNVGQFPGRWSAGTKATVLEGLEYEKKRVVFRITLTVIEREEVVASIVNTQHLSISMQPNVTGSYTPTGLKFDLAQTLADLGISSIDFNSNLIAYMPDGSWAQEIGDHGWWFGKDGNVGSWGNDASAWISYGVDGIAEDEVGVCIMPNNGAAAGDVYVIYFGFVANNKIEMLEITINIVAGDDPSTATVVGTQQISADVYIDLKKSYSPQTFKFNADQVKADLGVSSLSEANLVAYDSEGSVTMGLTADLGFWFDKSGPVGGWGSNASVWISYGIAGADDEIGIYIYPESNATVVAGDVYNHKFGFFANGKLEWLDITVNVLEGEVKTYTGEIVQTIQLTGDLNKTEAAEDNDYLANIVEFDIESVKSALGISSTFVDGLTLIGKKADGTYTDIHTANTLFWYNKDGQICNYGDEGFSYYCEYYGTDEANCNEYPEDVYSIYVGGFKPNVEVGASSPKLEFGFHYNDKIVWFEVTLNII